MPFVNEQTVNSTKQAQRLALSLRPSTKFSTPFTPPFNLFLLPQYSTRPSRRASPVYSFVAPSPPPKPDMTPENAAQFEYHKMQVRLTSLSSSFFVPISPRSI